MVVFKEHFFTQNIEKNAIIKNAVFLQNAQNLNINLKLHALI